MSASRVEVDAEVGLFVEDLGEGPAVLMIAGFGMTHDLWTRQVAVLTEAGYRVICLDQRGHGASDKPLTGYEVKRLAEDAESVCARLGLREVSVVGHSFGGQVAFALASRSATQDSPLVTRLALIGSNGVRASRGEAFPFGAPPDALLPALLEVELSDRLPSRRRSIVDAFAASPDDGVVDWLMSLSRQMPTWTARACYRSMLTDDQLDSVPAVRIPVLQVVGADDPVHSARGARWLSEQLADSRLVRLEGCGHFPMLEAPDALESALLEFLPGLR